MSKPEAEQLAAAHTGNQRQFSALAEPYRRELQIYCYRLLGSLQDAEDLTQETFLRAWQRLGTFEGRASFRAWLYKIASHACFDALDKRPQRALPPTTHPPSTPDEPIMPPSIEPTWLEPLPDEWLADEAENPEARYSQHESVTFAFLIALQTLPPRQRAVLILRDVLDWHTSEVAEQLEMTTAAVNSALHRARETLTKHYQRKQHGTRPPPNAKLRELLDRYVQAWETSDVNGLVALLKADVVLAMPPQSSWYQGRADVGSFLSQRILLLQFRNRWRLRATRANGQPAFALYERQDDGCYRAHGVTVVMLDEEVISELYAFNTPSLVNSFGLPTEFTA